MPRLRYSIMVKKPLIRKNSGMRNPCTAARNTPNGGNCWLSCTGHAAGRKLRGSVQTDSQQHGEGAQRIQIVTTIVRTAHRQNGRFARHAGNFAARSVHSIHEVRPIENGKGDNSGTISLAILHGFRRRVCRVFRIGL